MAITMAPLNGFASTAADIECRVTMESWNLNELEVLPRQPEVLDSESEGRAIVINLPKGEQAPGASGA